MCREGRFENNINSFPCICSGDPGPAWGAKQDGSRGEGMEGVHLAEQILPGRSSGQPGEAHRAPGG